MEPTSTDTSTYKSYTVPLPPTSALAHQVCNPENYERDRNYYTLNTNPCRNNTTPRTPARGQTLPTMLTRSRPRSRPSVGTQVHYPFDKYRYLEMGAKEARAEFTRLRFVFQRIDKTQWWGFGQPNAILLRLLRDLHEWLMMIRERDQSREKGELVENGNGTARTGGFVGWEI